MGKEYWFGEKFLIQVIFPGSGKIPDPRFWTKIPDPKDRSGMSDGQCQYAYFFYRFYVLTIFCLSHYTLQTSWAPCVMALLKHKAWFKSTVYATVLKKEHSQVCEHTVPLLLCTTWPDIILLSDFSARSSLISSTHNQEGG